MFIDCIGIIVHWFIDIKLEAKYLFLFRNYKGGLFMKRYLITMNRGSISIAKPTNSLKLARMLANSRIWDCARIHDLSTGDVRVSGKLSSIGRCIYTKRK